MISKIIYKFHWSQKLHIDVSVIMWHKVGEYGLEGGVWNVIQHEKSKNS